MAWDKGYQPEKFDKFDALAEAKALTGELTDEQARVALYKLLRQNLGFTWALLSRGAYKIFEFQEIIMNGWFKKDYSIMVAGRGVGKSYLLAIYCLLYCMFNPNVKIVLVANNFRRVKDIFSQMEKFLRHRDAILLRQCFDTKIGKANDQYLIRCWNGSQVKGLPLGVGENLRGERANVLIIDEGLLISEHVQETILRPFLTAKLDVADQEKVKSEEDELIKAGKMKEEDRTQFPNNKLIVTSSASYQFEYLYEGIYKPYIKIIQDEHRKHEKNDPSYFVCRMSFRGLPPDSIMDESVLKAASEGKEENPIFQREYCAMFVDASDGYFNVKRLHECTYKDGQMPTTQVKGAKGAKYILAIDPAYGNSRANDFFAMGVYMLNEEDKTITQVHSYGKAGADVKEHFEYLIYLLKEFNIVYTIIDGSGTEFIDAFNNSVVAQKFNMSLGYIEADFELEGEEYVKELRKAKSQWNITTRRFVYPQIFSSVNNRRMNEYLQGGISARKVWFASPVSKHETEYEKAVNFDLPFKFKDNEGEEYTMTNFLDDQDDWIGNTKKQLALIEVKSTGQNGALTYDIPTHLKKSKSEKRARRDNYTCLLLAYYGSKHYFDMISTEEEVQQIGFEPFFI